MPDQAPLSDPPALPKRSRALRIVLVLLAVFVVLPVLAVFLFSVAILGPPGLDGETDRYRTAIEVVVDDHGQQIRNKVIGECGTFRSSGWNTGGTLARPGVATISVG